MGRYSNLIQALKGGPGSGNFGHSGRPGKRGGSSPMLSYNYGGLVVKGKPKLGDFISLFKWEQSGADSHEVPVHKDASSLPPVQEGYTRLSHGTRMRNINSITQSGLKSGAEVGSGERIDTILGVKGAGSGFGDVSIVFDLPTNGNKWRSINDSWVEISGTVQPSQMKGLILNNVRASSNELGDIIAAYRERYGDNIVW